MIAVAVADWEVDGVCSRLRAAGVGGIDVVAPGGTRRVVLGVPGEGRSAAEVAAYAVSDEAATLNGVAIDVPGNANTLAG